MPNKKIQKGIVLAFCVSKRKHTAKKAVESVFFKKDFGIKNDAHAGDTHRQVSILDDAAISKMKQKGVSLSQGSFGENIIMKGLNLKALKIADQIKIGPTAVLEVTQIGKDCHEPCAIFKKAGYCIMPSEGIFARVVSSGKAKALDPVRCI